MDFEQIITERQSIRMFSNKQVEKEKLNKILDAGILAPTAKNIQPIKIFVLQSEKSLEILDKATPCRYGANTVLLICADKNEAFNSKWHSTCEIDGSIVTTFMMLEATNLELDNIWIDCFDRNILINELNLESNLQPISLLDLGYRADDCPESPNHGKRKNIKDIVIYK